jgi:hypothetical protein
MHETAGHATLGYVRLQVGGRPLGFVGLAWRAASPALTPDQRGVVTALAQQLALALELDRLAATAAAEQRQAAVLEERTRLAREIHDTLAQGLAGIVMQLRAARATLGPLEGASTPALDRVERLARENLVEARRSLAMLRPAALDRGGLDVALRDLVSGRAIRPSRYRGRRVAARARSGTRSSARRSRCPRTSRWSCCGSRRRRSPTPSSTRTHPPCTWSSPMSGAALLPVPPMGARHS